ncbi:uncharacterized protein G2W53_007603 [Senna tora]|uniref:Uncharacterized protein n=1 Tax=Senna tora TaxID=362788 RepID=A0A834X6G2_9FABA|nr:uncharacterized protein G2W53_007603 [Senna tora]
MESQKNLRSTIQTCCTSESNRSLQVVFGIPCAFNTPMRIVIAWKECEVMSKQLLNQKSRMNLKRIPEVQVKRIVAQVSPTDRFAMYLGIRVDLILECDL